jgi:hypothetical protein
MSNDYRYELILAAAIVEKYYILCVLDDSEVFGVDLQSHEVTVLVT